MPAFAALAEAACMEEIATGELINGKPDNPSQEP